MKRAWCIILALAAAAAPALGADDGELAVYDRPEASRQASLTLPLEQILAELSQRLGYSFIFDSRVTRGKQAPPLDAFEPPEVALDRSLKSANLSLHKINERTFAIKSAPTRIPAAAIEVASAAAATPALVDAIVVTATAATPLAGLGSPNILSIDEDALALLDAVKPADVIYELPQSFSTFTPANTMLLGALSGISLVDLRGLGPARTQVLVNGRRRTVTPGGNQSIVGVDLNAIAEPFLERIEIVASPGGATVGTEAVAGSINFVTKKYIEGIETGVRYGVSQRGDAEEVSAYILAGTGLADDLLHIDAGFNFTNEGGLIGADRKNTSTSWGIDQSTGELIAGFGGSSISPEGFVAGAILNDGRVSPFTSGASRRPLSGAGGLAPFSRGFNTNATQQFLVPAKRVLGFVSIRGEPSANIDVFLEGHFGWTSNESQLAPLPTTRSRGSDPLLGDAIAVDIAHPTVPSSVSALYAAQFGAAAESIIIERRYVELGPREQTNERTYVDIAAGARFDAGSSLSAEVAYRYGRSGVLNIQSNLLDKAKTAIALDATACAAAAGCEPIDLFRLGGISARAADFIRADPLRRKVVIDEHELRGSLAGGIDGILSETLELSGGLSLRSTSLFDEDLSPHSPNALGAFVNDTPSGDLNIVEGFASVDAPLLRSSAVGDLDLSLAGRVTASSEYDPVFNFESAGRFQPAEAIELFAQVHVGRRPPNLIELFGRGPSVSAGYSDPCGSPAGKISPVVAANCFGSGALAVTPGFSQTNLLARGTMIGNPDLRPEEIISQAYGASITPTAFISGLPGRMKLSATWLSYDIDDTIREGSFPLDECYESRDLSAPACGNDPLTGLPLIERDPLSRQVVVIGSLLQNRGYYVWRGVDLGFDYVIEPSGGPFEKLWINGQHTIALRAEIRDIADAAPIRQDGLVTDPRHVSRISIGGEIGPVAANLYLQRRASVETASGGIATGDIIPASVLVDLTTRVTIREGIVATFAVENLTDHIAPVVAFGSVGNTFPEYYDLIGRRFSIGIKGAF